MGRLHRLHRRFGRREASGRTAAFIQVEIARCSLADAGRLNWPLACTTCFVLGLISTVMHRASLNRTDTIAEFPEAHREA